MRRDADGKKLISLLLALCLLLALPLPAFAEDDDGENAEEAVEAYAEEIQEETPARIALQFTSELDGSLALLTLLDAEGQPVPPFTHPLTGVRIPGCYLLEPGTYYYYLQDPDGLLADLPPQAITLDADTVSVQVALNLGLRETEEEEELTEEEPEEELEEELEEETEEETEAQTDAQPMPVIIRCERGVDLSGLVICSAEGVAQEPYTEPESGETHYDWYLLLPGEYVYLYRDPAGEEEARDGRFTVTEEGMQTVTLKLRAETGMSFSGTVMNPAYSHLIPPSLVPELSVTPEESLEQLRQAVEYAQNPDDSSFSMRATFRAGGTQSRFYESTEAAGEAVKRALLQRLPEITVRLISDVEPSERNWWLLCGTVYNTAIRHSGAPTEGDYLRYEYGGVNCDGSVTSTMFPDLYVYEFIYAPYYFTTPEQEAELDGRVAAILGSLELSGKSDEQKIRAIYDYLCRHVSYFDPDTTLGFTAYSALIDGRATCQGYSVAFYRLCLASGVDARVVTSLDIRHAWNIARVDGNRYYALDATWDRGKGQDEWEYYLKGRTSWLEDHPLGDEFESGSFSDYTFPEQDYSASRYAIIRSVSVLFDGMLRIKYYFRIPDSLLESEGACIQFSRGDETVLTVPLSAGRSEDGYRCFYCGVKVEEMDVPVRARILDASGELVEIRTQSGRIYANGFFFSAMDYAREMKASGSATMRELAQALQDYGTAAQNYFRNDAAGSVSAAVKAVSSADLAPWSIAVEGEKPAGIVEARVSVLFKEDNSLRIYFRFADGADPDAYQYAVDGESATLHRRGDGACYLSVDNISADRLHEAHRFMVSDGTHLHIISASVLGYGKTAIDNGGEAIADLGRALYRYNLAARAYFGT